MKAMTLLSAVHYGFSVSDSRNPLKLHKVQKEKQSDRCFDLLAKQKGHNERDKNVLQHILNQNQEYFFVFLS